MITSNMLSMKRFPLRFLAPPRQIRRLCSNVVVQQRFLGPQKAVQVNLPGKTPQEKIFAAIAAIAAVGGVGHLVHQKYVQYYDRPDVVARRMLRTHLADVLNFDYQPRDSLRDEFLELVLNDVGGIIVLYGNKGCGKSSVWKHELCGKSSILEIVLDGTESQEKIIMKVLKKLTVGPADQIAGAHEDFIKKVLLESKVDGRLPVLIFNVRSQENDLVDPHFARHLTKVAKGLSCDDPPSCVSVLDISVMALASDFAAELRTEFIRVPAFTEEEALDFLNGKQLNVKDLDVKGLEIKNNLLSMKKGEKTHVDFVNREIFDKIGTRPQVLKNVASKIVAEVVSDLEEKAADRVDNLLEDPKCLKMAPVLKKLAKRGGMRRAQFKREAGLTKVSEINVLAKEYKVFQFDIKSNMVELRSTEIKRYIESR